MALAMAWSAVSGQHRAHLSDPRYQHRGSGLCLFRRSGRAPMGSISDGRRWRRFGELAIRRRMSCICTANTAVKASWRATLRPFGAGGTWIPGLIDPTANGRNQTDGYRLIQLYQEHGLRLEGIENPVESGILDVWQRMSSGRLKVFASLGKYLEERRLYRRDEKDQIVKDHDGLQDATRCLVGGLSSMRIQPVKSPLYPEPHAPYGNTSWME